MLPPGMFVSETGFSMAVDARVMKTACEDSHECINQGRDAMSGQFKSCDVCSFDARHFRGQIAVQHGHERGQALLITVEGEA